MSKLLRNDAAWEIVDVPPKQNPQAKHEALLVGS
jgi:hypothetical protein